MTRTELRRATPDDAEHVAAVVRTLKGENTSLSEDMTAAAAAAWIERLGDQGTIIVAFDGSIPAAFGSLEYSGEEPETGVLGVWVVPEHRRRGLATEVAEALLDFARERGYKRIRGRLSEGNEPALSFLSSIGAMVPLRNPEMSFELPL